MNATVGGLAPVDGEFDEPSHGWRWAFRDSTNEAGRHLRAGVRNIDILIFALLQPLMFVLLFRYVFGGSIKVPGISYNQYLMPGIFAQTVVFGTSFTTVGIAEDLHKGFVDRLRSLPISQSAVLIGRTFSDLIRNMVTFTVMLVVAFAIGFRFDGGLARGLEATAMVLALGYALSWIQILVGMSVKSVEAANSAGFIWMFPLTFVSSAFVSTASMTPWLRHVADANPFTTVTNATRALYNGRNAGGDVWQAWVWIIGITVLFAAISIQRFARTASR
jgi:ABC-2 type transport system permease protein/oleandomycin transport system permease protein